MKMRFFLFIFILLAIITVIGLFYFSPKNITGKISCLPGKLTKECALGLLANDGKNYHLIAKDDLFRFERKNTDVTITGLFKPEISASGYNTVGSIVVLTITEK